MIPIANIAGGLTIEDHKSLNGVAIGVSGFKGFRKTIKEDANLDDTLGNMKQIALRDKYQVEKLAKELEGNNIAETCENIWNFLRENTAYKLDQEGIEELRTPARSLVDGKEGLTDSHYGIDCDDYTILISAMLLCLGIPHQYRVAAYRKKGKFQHIYPVAFDLSGHSYVIDCVPEIPSFNYEAKPIKDLKTVPMDLQELSGLGQAQRTEEVIADTSDLRAALNEPFSLSGLEDADDKLLEGFLSGFGEVDSEEKADLILESTDDVIAVMDRGLLAEVNKARQSLEKEKTAPTQLSQLVNVDKELSMLNVLMELWEDAEERDHFLENAISSGSAYSNFYQSIKMALDKLADGEGLSGIEDEKPIYLAQVDSNMEEDTMEEDELGLFKSKDNTKKGGLKTLFKKVGQGIKKVTKAVVRFNPATILVRNAILLTLKINLAKIASRLIYGYLTQAQAEAQGLDLNEWRKLVDAKDKGETFFIKVGGKAENFRNAIIQGRAQKVTGLQLSGLGVAAAAATAAAASPFIVFMKTILNKINPANLFKKIKEKQAAKKAAQAQEEQIPGESAPSFKKASPQASLVDFPDSQTAALVPLEDESTTDKMTLMEKMKSFWTKHKKKIIIGGIGGVFVIIAIIIWTQMKKRKKRSLSGIKAARTRARNRKKTPTLKGRPLTRRNPLKGSTTILKIPTKSVTNARVSKRSNASRLRAMHQKAKQLQKNNPKANYSSLLKRAAKLV